MDVSQAAARPARILPSRPSAWRQGCRAFVALLLLCATVAAQDLRDPRWGFDNTVVPNRFNLLTVTVSNPTKQPIDKILQLQKGAALGNRRFGAPIEQRCFVGPGQTRTMQFRPYVSSGAMSWIFDWKSRDAKTLFLPSPSTSSGATVLFEDPDLPRIKRLRITPFAPRDLPTSADLMDSLREVVLDSEPEVTAAQRGAFLDWLRRGGRVHILHNDKGEWPPFSEDFEVLNLTDKIATYGAGRIHRHPFKRSKFEKKDAYELLKLPLVGRGGSRATPLANKLRRHDLAIAVELDYGWGLIFSLAIVYLALVGPVFYRLSSRNLSWYTSLLLLAGLIGMATWVFAVIGARGGEVSKSRSFSIARLAGDDYEVTRYSLVFVTAGGDYHFTSDAPAMFSSAQDSEVIHGTITNGTKPNYTIDMPRNSQRLIVQKSRLPGPPANAKFDGAIFETTLPLQHDLFCVNRGHLIHFRKFDRNKWREIRRERLSSFVRNYEPRFQTLDVRDVLIDRCALRNRDLSKTVTELEHFIFFGATALGDAPEEFRLQGKGPSLDLGADEGRTVFRFDLYTDQ